MVQPLNPYQRGTSTAAVKAVAVQKEITTQALSAARGAGGERLFNDQGDMNASSRKDAIVQLRSFTANASAGGMQAIARNTREAALSAVFGDRNARRQLAIAAGRDIEKFESVAAGIAAIINERAPREGYVRRLLNAAPLSQGEVPRIQMPNKSIRGVISAGESTVDYQTARSRFLYPTELSLTAFSETSSLERAQSNNDMLEETYNQTYESIIVQEDRLLYNALHATADSNTNPTIALGGNLTPAMISQIKRQLTGWGLPVGSLFMSNDFWDDLIGQASFSDVFDPVTKYNLIQEGQMGSLYGITFLTDSFRDPNYRILKSGEMFLTAAPEYLGAYTDRGGVEATPVDRSVVGRPTKGWAFEELFSLGIINTKGVVRIRR